MKFMGWNTGVCCVLVGLACVQVAKGDDLPSPMLSAGLMLDSSTRDTMGWPEYEPYAVGRFQTVLSGIVQDNASTPDSSGWLRGGFGHFQASGRATHSGGMAWGLYGTTQLSSSVRDTLRIVPADEQLLGQRGCLTASIEMSGAGEARVSADWSATREFTRSSYEMVFHAGTGPADWWKGTWQPDSSTGSLFSGEPLGRKTVKVDFVFGQDFYIAYGVSAYTNTGVDWAGIVPGAVANLDFEMQWMGFSGVQDASGQTVADYSIVSASGTDWSRPVAVPEPMAATWLVAGTVLLIRRGRHGGAPCASAHV